MVSLQDTQIDRLAHFPVSQVLLGLALGIAGYILGRRLFLPHKPGISRLSYHLRTLGALSIMAVGLALGQILGHLLAKMMGFDG
jgi:hypothetical protein